MKSFLKMFLIFLLVFLIASPCLGTLSYSAHNAKKVFRNGYAFSGHPSKDYATQWAQDVEDMANLGFGLGTGTIYYVDSGVLSEGDGTSWLEARNTLDEAINLCDGSAGDVILVAQGHAETLSTASAVALDVTGVAVLGQGRGSLMPTFTFSSPSLIPFRIAASSIALDNLLFKAATVHSYTGSQAVPAAIYVASVDDYSITNCEFRAVSAGKFIRGIQIAELSDRGYIAGNKFELSPSIDLACSAAIQFSTVSGITIEDNTIVGICDLGVIYNAKACQDVIIRNNLAYNGSMSADSAINDKVAISITNGSSGLLAHNDVATNLLPAAMIVGDDCTKMMNRVVQSDGDEFSGFYENLYTSSFATGAGSTGTGVASQVSADDGS